MEQNGGGVTPTGPAACTGQRGRRSSPTDMLFLESSQLKFQSATPCLSLIKELIDEHHVCSCNALLSLTQIQEGATCLKMWIMMRELDRIHLTIWSMMNDDLIQHLLFMMTTKTALVL